MIFETHAHYDDSRFKADRDEILNDLKNHDISYVVNVGCDLIRSKMSVMLANNYDFMYASIGFHPHSADELDQNALEILREMSKDPKVVAIGEIGLDYYYDNSPRDVQKVAFEEQLKLAIELDLPVVIHDRDAHQDCLDIINKYPPKKLVYHCYSGSVEYAQILVKMGYKMSFGGTCTFKNNRVAREVIKAIPIENIMLETDCPYLTPEPHRGERNDSRHLHLVAKKIAEIRGMTYEEVCIATTNNAKEFFNIK